jgi:hypothetical protein
MTMRRELSGLGEIIQCEAVVALAARKGINVDPRETARRRGFQKAAREYATKAAEAAVLGSDGFLASEPMATAVIGSIARASLAGEIIAAARPAGGFHGRYLVTDTSKITAAVIGEGMPVPAHGTSAVSITLDPAKIGAIVTYTDEVAADPHAAAGLEHDFSIIAQRGADATILAATAPDSSASFGATDDSAADMLTLFGGLGDLSGIAPPILAASPATLLRIGLLRDAGGWVWPEVGLAGGHMLGCPIFACDALADGVLRATSGEALAARFGGLEIATNANSTLEMSDAPTQDAVTGSGSTMVSLFQSNVIAVRFLISYAIIKLRDTASAELVGIEW